MTITIKLADRRTVATTISDEDQAILIQIRDNLRNNYFLIGDIANKYIYESINGDYAVDIKDIYNEIGKIIGKSGRTVRYYAEEAVFYTQDARDEYDILPFAFFVFARSMGDKWKDVLDYAMEHPHYSLDAIKAHFFGLPLPNTNSNDTIDDKLDSRYIPSEVGQGDRVSKIGPLINTMIDLSAKAITLVNNAAIPEEKKQELIQAAIVIRNIILSLDR